MLREIKLGELSVYPYSVLMILGGALCFVCFLILSFTRHKEAQDENIFALTALVISIFTALPAAMVFDSLFKMAETGKFRFKGATFYGGLICALIAFTAIYSCKRNKKIAVYDRLCDLVPGICFGHCLGRIGCFAGGCCFGKPVKAPLGVIFPEGTLPYDFYGGAVSVHPTQLYEALFLVVIGIFFLVFAKRDAFPLYLIIYGSGRLFIEFFRNDDRGGTGLPLSPAQLISLILIFIGSLIFFIRQNKKVPD